MDDMLENLFRDMAGVMHRVESTLDNRHVSDEDLFALLTDEDSRVGHDAERVLNSAGAGSRLAKRVDSFVKYLRGRLGSEAEGLPDSWVVKSFGFNLVTDDSQRPPVFVVVDEYASLIRGQNVDVGTGRVTMTRGYVGLEVSENDCNE